MGTSYGHALKAWLFVAPEWIVKKAAKTVTSDLHSSVRKGSWTNPANAAKQREAAKCHKASAHQAHRWALFFVAGHRAEFWLRIDRRGSLANQRGQAGRGIDQCGLSGLR